MHSATGREPSRFVAGEGPHTVTGVGYAELTGYRIPDP